MMLDEAEELYARIQYVGEYTYTQPLNQLVVLIEEILEAAIDMDGQFDINNVGKKWTVELVKMKPSEYEKLPEM